MNRIQLFLTRGRARFGGQVAIVICGFLAGCQPAEHASVQGYIEGEFIYVASPLAGSLETLSVQRGVQVEAGAPLFSLECGAEKAERDEAARRLWQAQAQALDVQKARRPAEISAAAQQLEQSRAALALSEKNFTRQETLFRTGASAASDFDAARAQRDQDQHRVSQLEADLEMAKLGARDDQIVAAEANVRAWGAAVSRADWNLSQKRQSAPATGLVFDTLFRQGEWVPAGRPVISLLPPANIKARAFVSEQKIGSLQVGKAARVFVDGIAEAFAGKISYISPQAEYTPPVIYSAESRGKLVFLIEIIFPPETAAKLHPGQPVDVQF